MFSRKDNDFFEKSFEKAFALGEKTIARTIRFLLKFGKWIILAIIALFFAIIGIIAGSLQIRKRNIEKRFSNFRMSS